MLNQKIATVEEVKALERKDRHDKVYNANRPSKELTGDYEKDYWLKLYNDYRIELIEDTNQDLKSYKWLLDTFETYMNRKLRELEKNRRNFEYLSIFF